MDEEGLDGSGGIGAVLVVFAVAAVAGAVDHDPVAAGLLQGDGVGVLRGQDGGDRAAAVCQQASGQEGVGPVVPAADQEEHRRP